MFTGLERNRYNLFKNKNHFTSTVTDTSGFTCISHDISDLINERKEQEDKDFQLALKLQKEFDLASKKAANVERKKGTVDGYLLRSESETSESCSKNTN